MATCVQLCCEGGVPPILWSESRHFQRLMSTLRLQSLLAKVLNPQSRLRKRLTAFFRPESRNRSTLWAIMHSGTAPVTRMWTSIVCELAIASRSSELAGQRRRTSHADITALPVRQGCTLQQPNVRDCGRGLFDKNSKLAIASRSSELAGQRRKTSYADITTLPVPLLFEFLV